MELLLVAPAPDNTFVGHFDDEYTESDTNRPYGDWLEFDVFVHVVS